MFSHDNPRRITWGVWTAEAKWPPRTSTQTPRFQVVERPPPKKKAVSQKADRLVYDVPTTNLVDSMSLRQWRQTQCGNFGTVLDPRGKGGLSAGDC